MAVDISELKAVLALALAGGLLAGAVAHRARVRTVAAGLLVLATVCFLIVALVHVCEAWHVLPAFGWGQPHSVGHHVDFVAALSGLVLATAAIVSWSREQSHANRN